MSSSSNLPSTPSDAPPALCDCERGYNGLGMAVGECDCQSMPASDPEEAYQVDEAIEATNGLHDACITRVQAGGIRALVARISADAARIRELEAAGRALLTCPAIADIASEDRDPEDVVAERKMRAALGSRRDG